MHKILFVEGNVDGTVGGSYFSLLYLIKNIDKKRFNVSVVFYFNNPLIGMFKEAGAKVYVLKNFRSLNLFPNYRGSIRSPKMIYTFIQKIYNFLFIFINKAVKYTFFIKKNRFDIVHLNNTINKNHEWMLASILASIPCVTHESGINNSFSKTARFFARRLNKIICISKAVQKCLINNKIDIHNSIIIYNGINPIDIKVNIQPEKLRKKYGIDIDSFVVGVVGNIKPWKGQKTLIEAINILKNKNSKMIYCFFVGGTSNEVKEYKSELKNLIERYGINEFVFFTDYVKNPADYMNMFDIVIHTSIEPEPFGRVLLEAMSLKKPLIATSIGAPLEIIKNQETGILVKPNDPVDLADAIILLMKDSILRQSLVEEAFSCLLANFSIEANVGSTQTVYDCILEPFEA